MHRARRLKRLAGYVSHQARCDCGQPATRRVWFYQFSPESRRYRTSLELCEECCCLILAEDPGVCLTPFGLVETSQRGHARKSSRPTDP
jgi:hypothetical protein